MPELVWTGKEYVLGLADKVPVMTLRRVPEASIGEGSPNAIVHGDNLRALKALLPDYRGRVKLVFIDPPYNMEGESWLYEDPIGAPDARRWNGEVNSEDVLRHDKWLCMMYPRLTLLRELLRPDGTIFISIGDTEVHHLRLLMDEVFGEQNFLACAVWEKGASPGSSKDIIPSVHNYILIYARDSSQVAPVRDKGNCPDSENTGLNNALTTWWTREKFGDSQMARRELRKLFPELDGIFAIPKPTLLVRRIVQMATERQGGDIVLDCFAGSGTTAHAVLSQNAVDGGNRRFILIERGDYARGLTAERVRRVIGRGHPGFEYLELC